MPLPLGEQFARSSTTIKGVPRSKTVCTFCGASQSSLEEDSLPGWEKDHTCNRTVTEARFMVKQAVEMQSDAKRMHDAAQARRARSLTKN
jgi:hypothetical protein